MPEKFPYNLEKAQEEAAKMRAKIESGEAENYKESEKLVENEIAEKQNSLKHEFSPEIRESENNEEAEKNGEMKKISIPEIGEITYYEKTVMFPEHIIKKTGGVKGYIRKTFDKKIIDLTELKWNKDHQIDEAKYRHRFNPNKLLFVFYKELTNGNFPYKTYNHVLSGYRGSLKDSLNLFKQEKFLLQEMASEKSIYNSVYEGGGQFMPFKTENNTQVLMKNDPNFTFSRDDFKNSNLYRKLKQSSNFLFLPEGLDVYLKGQVWPGDNSIEESPLFGFGTRNKIFQKYLKESEKIISNLTFSNKGFNKQGNILNYRGEKCHLENFLKNLENVKRGSLHSLKCLSGSTEDYKPCLRDHPSIPLIINHPNIPNLRWCHADYIAFVTKKGYNIFEMIT